MQVTVRTAWQDVLRDSTLINGTSAMSLPDFAPNISFLPTRDNRFVTILPAYPSQQVKAAELLRCGLVYDPMPLGLS